MSYLRFFEGRNLKSAVRRDGDFRMIGTHKPATQVPSRLNAETRKSFGQIGAKPDIMFAYLETGSPIRGSLPKDEFIWQRSTFMADSLHD